ncbi:MAG: AMP-binding protein [Isosphaeraceae bacterium]|nr:AMP-binding protein [Isosphaeraceae bacterium]
MRPTTTVAGAPDFPLPPLPDTWRSLGRAFFESARTFRTKEAIADSTGQSLSYGDLLTRSIVLARVLKRLLGPAKNVGLFLPSTVAGCVANLSLALLGKTAVNLNYTAGQAILDSCVDQAGIVQILTSPKILQKSQLTPRGELIHLEDLKDKVTIVDKVVGALAARFAPASLLSTMLPGLAAIDLAQPATIIFTSGSTGDPKGVVLSHSNILSNVHQIDHHIDLLENEVVLGVLPFFHSFGYTVTIWTVLCLGKKVVFHFNPLDSRVVADLCEKHGVTMMASTPTFFRSYLQRGRPEQFAKLVHLLLGAEKLKPDLAREIQDRLKIDPMEGYGCTETGPVVSVNVCEEKLTPDGRPVHGNRLGCVGLLLPGTSVKTLDPDSGEELPRGTEGVIAVKGPQIMSGYLGRPEETAKVLIDGWYTTGDLGYQDADGFLRITDRRSRFSKIGGEMVPHAGVEAAIVALAGVSDHELVVTSVPDAKRGERLAVVHTTLPIAPTEIYRRLNAGEMPKLWIPSADDFVEVEAIPVLGTGKVDLRGVRRVALERLGTPG